MAILDELREENRGFQRNVHILVGSFSYTPKSLILLEKSERQRWHKVPSEKTHFKLSSAIYCVTLHKFKNYLIP